MLRIFLIIITLLNIVDAKDYFIRLTDKGLSSQANVLNKNWGAISGLNKSGVFSSTNITFKKISESSLPDEINKWLTISVEPDGDKALEDLKVNGLIDFSEPVGYFKTDFLSDDSLSSQQWYLDKIDLKNAWKITKGDPNIIVGVIDTGIDFEHPDLDGSLWINSAEDLNGNGRLDEMDIDNIDNDNNGFVDDVVGWDFTDAPRFADGGDYVDPDNEPWDEFGSGHGTQCAGIIAARDNNGKGIAGIAPGSRVMALRAGTANGYLEEDDVGRAILYALDNGASIINMSFGDVALSQFLKDVIGYSYNQGIIFIASAGNSSSDEPHYPSSLPQVISVGATNSYDALASFSNYGNTLDLVAPGVDIISTAVNGYNSVSGTSFSAPIISGVAALVLANDNSINTYQMRNILKSSATDIIYDGWDIYSGSGRVQASRALNVPVGGILEITSPEVNSATADNEIVVIGSASHPDLIRTEVSYGTGNSPESWSGLAIFENSQILNDTLATISHSGDSGIFTVKIAMFMYNNFVDEIHHTFNIDRTEPQISDLQSIPMFDGAVSTSLITFSTDDICTVELKIREKGEQKFSTIASSYQTRNHRVIININQFEGALEFYIKATNQSGLIQIENNNGFYYDLTLEPGFNWKSFEMVDWQIPNGYMLNFATDLDHDGRGEIIISRYDEISSFGPVEIYEFNNGHFNLVDQPGFTAIPRYAGDVDNDGKSDLLLGFGQNSFLFESQNENTFPTELVWMDTTNFWASSYADLDNDNNLEITGRTNNVYRILENSGDNLFTEIGLLENTTAGENILGIPLTELTDLNNDGNEELIYGDYDGDIIAYSSNGNNQFGLSAAGATIHNSNVEMLSSDSSGTLFTATHTMENIDYEHEFDARYWSIEMFKKVGGNLMSQNQINTFGFADSREFDNGLAYHSFDNRGLLFASFFPNMYIFEKMGSLWEPVWLNEQARSNAILVYDFDNDGNDEFYFNNGHAIIGYTAKIQERPLAPYSITATPIDSAHIRVKWFTVNGAEKYYIYRGNSGSNIELFDSTTSNTFIDTVGINQKYFYAISSIDPDFGIEESYLSAKDSAQTLIAPKFLNYNFFGNRQLILNFDQKIKISDDFPLSIYRTGRNDFFSSALIGISQSEILVSFNNPFIDGNLDSLIINNLFGKTGVPVRTSNLTIPVLYEKNISGPYVKSSSWDSGFLLVNFSEEMDFSGIETRTFNVSPQGQTKTVEEVAGSENKSIRICFTKNTIIGAKGRVSYLVLDSLTNSDGIYLEGNTKVSLYQESSNLKNIIIYPQPVKPEHPEIVFSNLPGNVEITIFDINGRKIKYISHETVYGGVKWDMKDDNGYMVSTGIYFYNLKWDSQTKLGKIAVIR